MILTNCLGWETLPAEAPVRFHDGLTQTPQVAIDIRLTLDSEKNLQLCVDYAEQALHGEQVEAMLAALQRRILRSCQRADLAIAPRDFIDLAHYRHNDSEANYAPYPYLAQLAERLFGAQNGGNALICGEQTLTYRELGQQIATAIANLQSRGVQPGNVVALYLPRSLSRSSSASPAPAGRDLGAYRYQLTAGTHRLPAGELPADVGGARRRSGDADRRDAGDPAGADGSRACAAG